MRRREREQACFPALYRLSVGGVFGRFGIFGLLFSAKGLEDFANRFGENLLVAHKSRVRIYMVF